MLLLIGLGLGPAVPLERKQRSLNLLWSQGQSNAKEDCYPKGDAENRTNL